MASLMASLPEQLTRGDELLRIALGEWIAGKAIPVPYPIHFLPGVRNQNRSPN